MFMKIQPQFLKKLFTAACLLIEHLLNYIQRFKARLVDKNKTS